MWTLDDVKALVATGEFHHATARTIGEPRLFIYRRNGAGFRGYELVASIPDTDENRAYFASIKHGVSVGAYGAG
jgi:hypothetical protein